MESRQRSLMSMDSWVVSEVANIGAEGEDAKRVR